MNVQLHYELVLQVLVLWLEKDTWDATLSIKWTIWAAEQHLKTCPLVIVFRKSASQ